MDVTREGMGKMVGSESSSTAIASGELIRSLVSMKRHRILNELTHTFHFIFKDKFYIYISATNHSLVNSFVKHQAPHFDTLSSRGILGSLRINKRSVRRTVSHPLRPAG